MHAQIGQLELEALHAQVKLAKELEEVHRSFRAELDRTFPWGAPSSCARLTPARRLGPQRPQRSSDGTLMGPTQTQDPASQGGQAEEEQVRSNGSGAT